jgi:hypothetical protein
MSRLAKQARWHKRVVAFERSGLTRRAWCAREGVVMATLDYWRRRCRAVAEESRPALIPIMVSDAGAAVVAGAGTGVLEIEIGGGVRLRADAQVNAQWLASVLRGLR